MGRAYEVRKASIQKTGAIKAKTYSIFAKEIYEAAKAGVPEIESNISLKRMVDKAKKNQVPNEIIERAIEKAKGHSDDAYETVLYEGFGPGQATLIIKCLTDNVNRTVGYMRAAFNKTDSKLGVSNSVSYNYDSLGIISFKYADEEKIFNQLVEDNVNIFDFENENDEITISVSPSDFQKLKDSVEKIIPHVDYLIDEIGLYPKDKVTLNDEDYEIFKKLYNLLDEVEDVSNIYHNVNIK